MNKYTILWLEDNDSIVEAFIDLAYQNEIEIIRFKTAKKAIKELQKNYAIYQGIILDAIGFFEDEKNEKESKRGLGVIVRNIRESEEYKHLPLFILSGQTDITTNGDLQDTLSFNKIYTKSRDEDILLNNLKIEADKLEYTKIKNKYSDVFEACESRFLGKENTENILELALVLENERNSKLKTNFNNIRLIIETLFSKLTKLKIIPESINQNGLNSCSRYFSNKDNEYKLKTKYILHPAITFIIWNLINTTNDGSHKDREGLNLDIIDFVDNQNTEYLFKGNIFRLFDILIYFKEYIDKIENSTETIYWLKIETSENKWIYGTVQESSNGWGNFYSDCCQYERISISQERMLKLNINEKIHIRLGSNPKYVGGIQEYPDI